VPLLYRVVPTSSAWAWFWRLKQFVTGRVKPVSLRLAVFGFPEAFTETRDEVLPGKPDLTHSNGIKIRLLNETQAKNLDYKLQNEFGSENRMGVETGDGMEAVVSSITATSLPGGQAHTGITVDLLPRIHANLLELTAVGVQTELALPPTSSSGQIQTNFSVAARMQMSSGGAVFILDAPRVNGRRMGVLISARSPARRK
jgi:hypothetical protein